MSGSVFRRRDRDPRLRGSLDDADLPLAAEESRSGPVLPAVLTTCRHLADRGVRQVYCLLEWAFRIDVTGTLYRNHKLIADLKMGIPGSLLPRYFARLNKEVCE